VITLTPARRPGEPAGIGRYIRDDGDPAVAEVASDVVDSRQSLVGRLLLDVAGLRPPTWR
jgi:hypothetical protein